MAGAAAAAPPVSFASVLPFPCRCCADARARCRCFSARFLRLCAARAHRCSCPLIEGSLSTSVVNKDLKPVVGMSFEDEDTSLEFYKTYARVAGFSVRIGQRTNSNGVLVWRRYYCSRRGWKEDKGKDKLEGKKNRTYESKLTRCGCEAMFCIKQMKDNKFILETFVETHTHT